LVDPGTTAVWEKRLDDVVLGKADFRSVIDEIAGEAGRIISVLSGHTGGTVDLGEAARDGGKRRGFKSRPKAARVESKRTTREGGDSPRARKPRLAKQAMPDRAAQQRKSKRPDDNAEPSERRSRAHPPTAKMIAFAERLAKDRRAKLPPGYDKDFDTCRSFLDQNFGR
jgi:DNA topoisomerase III